MFSGLGFTITYRADKINLKTKFRKDFFLILGNALIFISFLGDFMVPQKNSTTPNYCGTFDQRLRRLMDAVQISKQVDLARILEVSPQTVNKAIKKQSIPFTWYKAISEKSGVPLEELTGVAPGVLEQFKRPGGALAALTVAAGQFLGSGPKIQATEQVCRMIRSLKGDSVDDLSHFLGLEPSDINQALLNGYIPDEWTDELAKTLNISRDILVLGYERYPVKAHEKTKPTIEQAVAVVEKEPSKATAGEESLKDDLLEAYKKIVSLQADNSRLEKENAALAQREKELDGELNRRMAAKETVKVLKALESFKKQAIADAAELRTDDDDDDDERVRGDYSDIMAGVTNKT